MLFQNKSYLKIQVHFCRIRLAKGQICSCLFARRLAFIYFEILSMKNHLSLKLFFRTNPTVWATVQSSPFATWPCEQRPGQSTDLLLHLKTEFPAGNPPNPCQWIAKGWSSFLRNRLPWFCHKVFCFLLIIGLFSVTSNFWGENSELNW